MFAKDVFDQSITDFDWFEDINFFDETVNDTIVVTTYNNLTSM